LSRAKVRKKMLRFLPLINGRRGKPLVRSPLQKSYVHDTTGDEELARQQQGQLELEDMPRARNRQRKILARDTVVGL
jgi:hypothetical protein